MPKEYSHRGKLPLGHDTSKAVLSPSVPLKNTFWEICPMAVSIAFPSRFLTGNPPPIKQEFQNILQTPFFAESFSFENKITSIFSKKRTPCLPLWRFRGNGFLRNNSNPNSRPQCKPKASWFLPERRRNEARGPNRPRRSLLATNRGQAVGSATGPRGSGSGILYGSSAPSKSWLHNQPGLCFTLPPLRSDGAGSRDCSLRSPRRPKHTFWWRRSYRCFKTQG